VSTVLSATEGAVRTLSIRLDLGMLELEKRWESAEAQAILAAFFARRGK